MKAIYSAANVTMVAHIRNVLEGHGIRCQLRNELLGAGAGEIPPIECWPTILVAVEREVEARRVIARALAALEVRGRVWHCPDCSEELEAQFTDCWRCSVGAS